MAEDRRSIVVYWNGSLRSALFPVNNYRPTLLSAFPARSVFVIRRWDWAHPRRLLRDRRLFPFRSIRVLRGLLTVCCRNLGRLGLFGRSSFCSLRGSWRRLLRLLLARCSPDRRRSGVRGLTGRGRWWRLCATGPGGCGCSSGLRPMRW